MQFPTDVTDKTLPHFLTEMTAIVGWRTWEERVKGLERQLNSNPLLPFYIAERHRLEFQFVRLRKQTQIRQRIRVTPDLYALCAFVGIGVRLYQNLTPAAQKRFCGRLRDGLQDNERGLLDLEHELATVGVLLLQGFDVTPVDLENGGGFDFLARRGSVELEVECKLMSGDLGRRVHLRDAVLLGGLLAPVVQKYSRRAKGGKLVTVTFKGRLTKTRTLHEAVRTCVERLLVTGETVNDPGGRFHCTVDSFDIASSPFDRDLDISTMGHLTQSFIAERYGKPNAMLLPHYSPGVYATVVLLESEQADRVELGIYRQLKSSAEAQFSRSRPGVLVARLSDMTPHQLFDIATTARSSEKPTVLQGIAGRLFRNPARRHIHTVAFLSSGNVAASGNGIRPRILQGQGAFWQFENPDHDKAGNPEWKIFRDARATGS